MPVSALLDHPVISQRYFFPRREGFDDPWWVVAADGTRLACARRGQVPDGLTVVHFHGNGEVVADYLDDFPALCEQLGCNLLLAEYRGYGMSEGDARLGRMLEDVAAVIAALGVDERRLVFYGRSVGSLFALRAARSCPGAAGLILESAVADVAERLLLRLAPHELGVTRETFLGLLGEVFDHRAILRCFTGRTQVMHCAHDGLVDVSHGRRLHAWAGADAELTIFPRGDHNTILAANAAAYRAVLGRFLQSLR